MWRPPSKRITISATTAIRSTSSNESASPSEGKTSEATAAATRKTAAPGSAIRSASSAAGSREQPGRHDQDDLAEGRDLVHALNLRGAARRASRWVTSRRSDRPTPRVGITTRRRRPSRLHRRPAASANSCCAPGCRPSRRLRPPPRVGRPRTVRPARTFRSPPMLDGCGVSVARSPDGTALPRPECGFHRAARRTGRRLCARRSYRRSRGRRAAVHRGTGVVSDGASCGSRPAGR